MTLFDVEELCRYWAEHPPLHLRAGVGTRQRPPRNPSPAAGGRDPMPTELAPGLTVGDVDAGLPPVALAFEQLKQRS